MMGESCCHWVQSHGACVRSCGVSTIHMKPLQSASTSKASEHSCWASVPITFPCAFPGSGHNRLLAVLQPIEQLCH
ncbi:rCG25356, isoform CRA_b [Rattus norvegicus]|uniref:RCG25356, isoform CRA_b n=1 Tax=Rattus norvegicus TaxID=10116 RepID=A6I2G9_RAT|nr:rCG25356, isoform CRA_b [Rattus norvegicus]